MYRSSCRSNRCGRKQRPGFGSKNRLRCPAAGSPSSSVRHEATDEHDGTGKTGLRNCRSSALSGSLSLRQDSQDMGTALFAAAGYSSRYAGTRNLSAVRCCSRGFISVMKILYLITRAERGGAQVHVLDLLKNLPAGYKPVLATGETGYLTEEAGTLGVPVHILPQLKQPMAPGQDLLALLAIARFIKSQSPALIHAHTSKAGLLGRFAGWMTS